MSAPLGAVPLEGSARSPLPGASASGDVDPTERIRVTVVVRRDPTLGPGDLSSMSTGRPSDRRYLDHKGFEAARGAARGDLAKVEAFAQKHGIDVADVDASRRVVILSGTAAQFNEAFGVRLVRYAHPEGGYRGHEGHIYVPGDLAPIVEAVLGLDDRPQARPHFRGRKAQGGVTYEPPQVAGLYDFPAGSDGSGQCVALIELGGGYATADLQTFFGKVGVPMPSIVSVSVDGASNSPTGDPNGPDGEVMLDVEVLGSVAPGAQIAVYFAPNTDAGFLDAITTAIHDTQHDPSVISISWGGPESTWTSQAMQAMDEAFQDAASLGISVFVAAGDDGSSDGVSGGLAHVDFPASAPYATGCGGTKLESNRGVITSEVVWNELPREGATGGGVSDEFPLPSWQAQAQVPHSANPSGHVGRGVPDVSGDADPVTGYFVCVDGTQTTIGGTSAVAPLWAGLMAVINQSLRNRVGYLNPIIYGGIGESGAFHDVTSGDNGAYSAKKGWDACSGWGSPNGAELLAALGPAPSPVAAPTPAPVTSAPAQGSAARLIIVGGAARSGTTLLQSILDSHSEIYGGPEFHVLPRVAELRRYLRGWTSTSKLSMFLPQDQVDRELRQFVMGLLTPMAAKKGKTRISEKTPSNALYFEELLHLFPEARCVHVVRHPGAVLNSLLRVRARYVQSNSPVPAFLLDSKTTANYVRRVFAAGLAAHKRMPGRVTVVKYEQLVRRPEQTVRSLCDSIGVEFEPGMLKPETFSHDAAALVRLGTPWHRAGEFKRPISDKRMAAWRAELGPGDLQALRTAFAGATDLLGEMGYSIPGPSAPVQGARRPFGQLGRPAGMRARAVSS
jgi:kumamolisin